MSKPTTDAQCPQRMPCSDPDRKCGERGAHSLHIHYRDDGSPHCVISPYDDDLDSWGHPVLVAKGGRVYTGVVNHG